MNLHSPMHGVLKTHSEKNKKNSTHVIFWAGFLRRHLKENLILSNKPPLSWHQCFLPAVHYMGWMGGEWMDGGIYY